MAKRRKKSKSSYPDPIDGFFNLCAGAATALITRSMLLRDIEKGEGEESLKAATLVFGGRSLLKGDAIGLGGMIGIKSALTAIDKQEKSYDNYQMSTAKVNRYLNEPKPSKEPPKYIWRKFCEDGTMYGVSPNNYETADEYEEALAQAKGHTTPTEVPKIEPQNISNADMTKNKYIWRKYCNNSTLYGIDPEDYETADDYEEALQQIQSMQDEI